MKTVVYLIRHSEKYKRFINIDNNDSFQLCNEKIILSNEGEEKAKKLSEIEELSNIDIVIASNYVRSIETAKYIADRNNKDIFIMDGFGERKIGTNSIEEYPKDFELKQYFDDSYKLPRGESKTEVTDRMYKSILSVINLYKGKRVAIVSHGTAISFLLSKWCKVTPVNIDGNKFDIDIKYKDKKVFNGKIGAPEVFKLTFNDSELIDIENVRY